MGSASNKRHSYPHQAPFGRRSFLGSASGLLGGALVLTACGPSGDPEETPRDRADRKAAEETSRARITITPADGTAGAATTSMVKVAGGRLTAVTMTTAQGRTVKGTLSADKSSWKPDAPLKRATSYEITARAADDRDKQATARSAFTTVTPANSFIGTFTPEDRSTVGVGMPVSLTFDKPVENKKGVEAAITVTCSSGQRVVGHWFSANRLDFRPEQYWDSGSTVTLELALEGVEASSGIQGVQRRTVTFRIGRSQVSTVDAATFEMRVVRDGRLLRTIPISAGSGRTPTYNGQMVISEKHKETRMDGATVGFGGEYDIPDVPHAMRLSTSGTFIHGNYWSDRGVFGSSNTSHGCIGLSDVQGAGSSGTNGAWFYDNTLLGDVVIVKNSPDKTIQPDNGLNAWNLSWPDWVKGSALQ
ncbi:Ig-like domain-containing protein [Streptomyces sp. NPDC058579]|uniref:L,D-transpeptidase n=1 Tax=Streptomyces sp. NPDC058579 TaxID=3346548 RepID=UPI00366731CB